MTLTEILLAVHIVGAVFWVGGNFIFNVFSWRVNKTANQEQALWFLELGGFVLTFLGGAALISPSL